MTKTDLVSAPSTPARASPTSLRTDRQPAEYLTRRQSADYIREELGRPMSFSTASKLAALGEFVAPALWWGRRQLYTREEDLRAWAEAAARVRAERPELYFKALVKLTLALPRATGEPTDFDRRRNREEVLRRLAGC